jgi:type II secretory pathway component GspD/PulD (secretin)
LVEIDVRALFSTLSSRNVGKILARPQVMVSEGNEGKIQVGEDFSIKTRDFAGNNHRPFFQHRHHYCSHTVRDSGILTKVRSFF